MESSAADPLPIFAGDFRHALDAKNRITIPAVWRQRESDGDPFIIFPDPKNDACLIAVPPSIFRHVCEAEAADLDVSLAERRVFKTLIAASARSCGTDKQGRMVLPEEYCKKIGLSGEVMLIGAYDRVELWAPAAWSDFKTENTGTLASVSIAKGV